MQTAHCCVMMVHNHYAVHVHVLCDYALLCNVQLSIRFMGSGITDAAVLMSYAVDVAGFAHLMVLQGTPSESVGVDCIHLVPS